jgi:hypothetical protein
VAFVEKINFYDPLRHLRIALARFGPEKAFRKGEKGNGKMRRRIIRFRDFSI